MALPPSLEELSEKDQQTRKKMVTVARTLFALLAAFIISQIQLDYVESYLYDLRFRFRPNPKTSGKIELVLITPETIKFLRDAPKATHHKQFLENILAKKPAAIFYSLDLAKLEGTKSEITELGLYAKDKNNLFFGTEILVMRGEEGKLTLPPPFQEFKMYSATKTFDKNFFAKDDVTRRIFLDYQGTKLLPVRLAGMYNPDILDLKNIRGVFQFLDSEQTFIDYHPKNSFPTTDFKDIWAGKVPDSIEGKIVIVGQDLFLLPDEYVKTPFSREVSAMTLAEMHANSIDTLIRNSSVVKAPDWVNWILIVVTSIFTIHIILGMRPVIGVVFILSSSLAFSLICYLLFWWFGLWVLMAPPLLIMFLSYYFFIPYRLIRENRRSWDYYQRHKLLSQVEELKSNFISMMSHDLKTPIARIQGMTDVIFKNQNPISQAQKEALETIQGSSEELLRFINAILQYGRVESQNVHLNLQARDINQLLQDVIKKYDFMATVKKIQISPQLEPLFPINVDPELIKQVFSNLIENAIKYSPEGSRVMVTSEEKNNKVVIQVSDQGQGIPEDELSNVFMKYFRSKNVKSSPIKGSGLGLYLAKYFTELHHGHIFVESSYGQGSTFTVELPL